MLQTVKNALVKERDRLFLKLQEFPFLQPYPSHANFILCSVTGAKSAKQLKAKLAKEGVMVRHYEKEELKNFIRISVGRPEQTDTFLSALAKVA
jgi:histidinol-phosphate aminotransferase